MTAKHTVFDKLRDYEDTSIWIRRTRETKVENDIRVARFPVQR